MFLHSFSSVANAFHSFPLSWVNCIMLCFIVLLWESFSHELNLVSWHYHSYILQHLYFCVIPSAVLYQATVFASKYCPPTITLDIFKGFNFRAFYDKRQYSLVNYVMNYVRGGRCSRGDSIHFDTLIFVKSARSNG